MLNSPAAQAAVFAVDDEKQIIVANDVTQCAADSVELVPMVEAVRENTGMEPELVLGDGGYRSERGFRKLEEQGVEALIPLGREGKTPAREGKDKPATQRMRTRLATDEGRREYAKRKHIVEPPIGWIRHSLGFRAFSLRGLAKTSGEWALVCLARNLKRMAHYIQWP